MVIVAKLIALPRVLYGLSFGDDMVGVFTITAQIYDAQDIYLFTYF